MSTSLDAPTGSTNSRRQPSHDDARPQLSDFAAEPPKAGRRVPEIALGLLVIAAFGLASLWWFTSATETFEVVSLSENVQRGDVIALDDLVAINMNVDDPIAAIGRVDAASLVGKVALFDIRRGTILTPSMFASDEGLALDEGVVGLELQPGQRPSIRMAPGDVVSVILTPDGNSDDELNDGGAAQVADVLVRQAVVVEFVELEAQRGGAFVALTMTESEAQAVAVAASQDRVRLIQVAEQR